MLFPAIWVLWNQDVAVGVRVHRWTFGWGRYRYQLDWGRWDRPDPKNPIDWAKAGLDGFLIWGKQMFDQRWGKTDLDRLFRNRPEWRRIVALGGARAHYVRLLLARELFHEPEASRAPEEGLSALEAALDLEDADIQDETWSISQRDTTRHAGPGTMVPPRPFVED